MAERIHLKWYHTFLFLFQAILTVTDMVTDGLTCVQYWESGEVVHFALCLTLIVFPLFVTCIWSAVASTSRALDRDEDEIGLRQTLIGVDLYAVNICLSFSCFGPTFHSLELFLYCVKNFRFLWQSKGGKKVTKEDSDLYYLYIHNLNMKLVEGLLESGPQLLLQLYTIMNQGPGGITTLQIVSVSISFLSLSYTITSSELVREYSGVESYFLHSPLVFVVNAALMAGRAGSFVFFASVLGWWLVLIISAHWFVAILVAFVLWNSKRVQHFVEFLFCHSYKCIFVFRLSALKNLRSAGKPMSKTAEHLIACVWYFFFAAENTAMILIYYFKTEPLRTLHSTLSPTPGPSGPPPMTVGEYDLYRLLVLVVVLGGTYGGLIIKALLWCCCTKQPDTEEEHELTRPNTWLIKDQGVRIRTVERLKL